MKLKLLLMMLTSTPVFAAKPETLTDYLVIQTKLAGDSMAGVSAMATKISDTEKGTKTAAISKKLSESKNIEEAREHFKSLSKEIVATTSKKELGSLKVAYCPMARAKWIQKEVEVRNPYYGASMLECGSIED